MRKRLIQRTGALVTVRRRCGPIGEVLIGIARCQSCEFVATGIIIDDNFGERYVVCEDCLRRAIQVFRGELKFPDESVSLAEASATTVIAAAVAEANGDDV